MTRAFIAGVAALCVAGFLLQEAAAAPKSPGMPGTATVSGTVSFRERVELPGMAVVHVELIDISGKDVRTATLGQQTVWTAWVPMPVRFRIEYDPLWIDPKHVYVVRARILDGEKLLFMNAKPYYVITQGNPSTADIIVVPAR